MKKTSVLTIIIETALLCGIASGCSKASDSGSSVGVSANISNPENSAVTFSANVESAVPESSAPEAVIIGGKADELAQAALKAIDPGELAALKNEGEISTATGVQASACDELAVYCGTSDDNIETVVVLKSKSEEYENNKSWLNVRLMTLKSIAEPTDLQKEALNGAVTGETESGYLYLIIHKDGRAAESALLAAAE